MTAVIRSLADSLRRFGDARLEALLIARPDLASPVPRGIAPLAARAASAGSARRALEALTLGQLHLVEALAVLEDGASPAELAAAVGAVPAQIAASLERIETLALVWGEDELHLLRPLREGLRTPAGLAPERGSDPSPEQAESIAEQARELLEDAAEAVAWGPAKITGQGALAQRLVQMGAARRTEDDALLIPRSVHLALRGGRVRRRFLAQRPAVDGDALQERIPGARTAQATERAHDALRVLRTVRDFDDDPPSVLHKGGLPQRDLKRMAARAGVEPVVLATILQAAWQAGLIGHDGQEWHPTRDWDVFRERSQEQRWAELTLAWAQGHHVAAVVGTPDATGAPRALLSDATFRDGVRSRRRRLLEILRETPTLSVTPDSLVRALAWAFPLVPAAILVEETEALYAEGEALGLIDEGALTVLGIELVAALEEQVTAADERLASALAENSPPPASEVLLDADGTCVIPGRPAEELLVLRDWTEPVSRGGGVTVRFTSASVRRALGAGRDPQALLDLLRHASRTPLPQALEYLLEDEQRRHGRLEVSRTSTLLVAEPEVLDLLQAAPEAKKLQLRRVAPTVATTLVDAGCALQTARRTGLAPQAVGADGRPSEEITHALHGGPVDTDLVRAEGPELRLPAAEAVARIRAADAGETELSVTDRLLAAIASEEEMDLGVVDGRGGIEVRRALPLALESGRLRARAVSDGEEFTVLLHRVTLG